MLGYQTALMKHSLSFIPEYVQTGNWRFNDGYTLGKILLNCSDPPSAIFAMNDIMAYGAIQAIKEAGLGVPNDISVGPRVWRSGSVKVCYSAAYHHFNSTA
jgi:DNA-binding LacI/PurR family transcriptional regulator